MSHGGGASGAEDALGPRDGLDADLALTSSSLGQLSGGSYSQVAASKVFEFQLSYSHYWI